MTTQHTEVEEIVDYIENAMGCDVDEGDYQHLKKIVTKAKEDARKEKQLDFAIQQLTGWAECKYGTGNIEDLVISMGLTLEEWELLEQRSEVDWLHEETKSDILKSLTKHT